MCSKAAIERLKYNEATQVRSLGREDPLEEGMATHFSILIWKIPWTEEPGWATVHRVTKSQTLLKRLSYTRTKRLYWRLTNQFQVCKKFGALKEH